MNIEKNLKGLLEKLKRKEKKKRSISKIQFWSILTPVNKSVTQKRKNSETRAGEFPEKAIHSAARIPSRSRPARCGTESCDYLFAHARHFSLQFQKHKHKGKPSSLPLFSLSHLFLFTSFPFLSLCVINYITTILNKHE